MLLIFHISKYHCKIAITIALFTHHSPNLHRSSCDFLHCCGVLFQPDVLWFFSINGLSASEQMLFQKQQILTFFKTVMSFSLTEHWQFNLYLCILCRFRNTLYHFFTKIKKLCFLQYTIRLFSCIQSNGNIYFFCNFRQFLHKTKLHRTKRSKTIQHNDRIFHFFGFFQYFSQNLKHLIGSHIFFSHIIQKCTIKKLHILKLSG